MYSLPIGMFELNVRQILFVMSNKFLNFRNTRHGHSRDGKLNQRGFNAQLTLRCNRLNIINWSNPVVKPGRSSSCVHTCKGWNALFCQTKSDYLMKLSLTIERLCQLNQIFNWLLNDVPGNDFINGWQLAKMKKSIPDMSLP